MENKLFSYEAKNLLLSMLYKIENAYRDYETVKVEVPSKKEYIENILRIIKEKCLKIFLVKKGTEEARALEENNVKYMVDKKNGEITCFENEETLLTAILKIDEIDILYDTKYKYLQAPLNKLINTGSLDSEIEVIRDFNGWSWDIVKKEIIDIEYNYIYQTILLLNGRKKVSSKKYKDVYNRVCKMAVEKYISSIDSIENKGFNNRLNLKKEEVKERLELFSNKKEFVENVTTQKKLCMNQIENIDKILNNNELLKKEYYSRNEKLSNKEKIFSVSYLVKILEKERSDLLEKIDNFNKIILPKEFIEQKSKLEEENSFLESIKSKLDENDIIALGLMFLKHAKEIINKIDEENKLELVKWMYKIRYYRFIPIDKENSVKDIVKLKESFEEVYKEIIDKALHLKIWDTFTDNQELFYLIIKEIFDFKINLLNINISCSYENKILKVQYYDDNILEKEINIEIENVRIKKKFKLFI